MTLEQLDASTISATAEIKALRAKLDADHCKAAAGSRDLLLAIRAEYLAARKATA